VITTNATCAQPDVLTLEGLRKMIDEAYAKFPPMPPDPWAYRPLRPSFAGLDIIERPLPPPKLQVSKEAESIFTPKDLAEMNAYLLERFGRHEQDCNMYHFSRYLSVPFGISHNIRSLISSVVA
jgi:hypothetical protein